MTGGIDVASANPLAHLKLRRGRCVSAGGHTVCDEQRHLICGKRRAGLLRTARRLSALDLRAGHQPALDEQFRHANQKLFIVGNAEILGWRNELFHVPRRVDVPLPPGSHCPVQRKHPRLPARMEDRFVFLLLDGTHAVHAAHVMDAVHDFAPAGRTGTLATPTIESRVTRPASCSSLSVSVPAGRSGTTR